MSNNLNFFYQTRDHKCNYYYFAFNTGFKDTFKDTFREHNTSTNKIREIEEHFPDIRKMLERNGGSMCMGVESGYILEKFDECDYVVVLTEIDKPVYSFRKEAFIDNLCGLIFLKEHAPKNTKAITDYLYITLVCAIKGIGGHLMNKCEEIAIKMGFNKIKLDSLDAPIGFYLYKGYKFDKSGHADARYEIAEDEEEKDPKRGNPYIDIRDIPEPKIGFVLTQHRNKNTYQWIVVKKGDQYKYMYLKPGYIQTFRRVDTFGDITYKPIFKPDVMDHIRRHNTNTKTFMLPNGTRFDTQAGVITTLKDISTYRLDREGVAMTKNLEDPRNSLLRTLTARGKKYKKKQKKKAKETSKRASLKAIRYLSQFNRKTKKKKLRKK